MKIVTAKNQPLIRGVVRHGNKRGRELGYPTVNLELHQDIQDGIYIAYTRVGKKWHQSIAFIGAAKTFGGRKRKLESYILDFNKMIYGQWVSIRLLKRLRENKKFTSVNALLKAMGQDEKEARRYFDSAGS